MYIYAMPPVLDDTMVGFWTQTAITAHSTISSAKRSEVMLVFVVVVVFVLSVCVCVCVHVGTEARDKTWTLFSRNISPWFSRPGLIP